MEIYLPQILLASFFAAVLLRTVIFKFGSHSLDDRAAPIYMSTFLLLAMLAAYPFFGHLLHSGIAQMQTEPLYFWLTVAKGLLLWTTYFSVQKLTRKSLSSINYALPLSLGMITVVNATLGEALSASGWIAAWGLFFLGVAFAFKGHLKDLSLKKKRLFAKVVGLYIILAALDHSVIQATNWYVLQLISAAVLLAACVVRRTPLMVWKEAYTHPTAIFAGLTFAAVDMLKFYQQVTIHPVSVVLATQAATIPFILLISSLVWKERSWKEQLVWGGLSIALILPVIFGK